MAALWAPVGGTSPQARVCVFYPCHLEASFQFLVFVISHFLESAGPSNCGDSSFCDRSIVSVTRLPRRGGEWKGGERREREGEGGGERRRRGGERGGEGRGGEGRRGEGAESGEYFPGDFGYRVKQREVVSQGQELACSLWPEDLA